MSFDPRVQELIEEVLDSGQSVEAVCHASPELLTQVREGLRKFRAMQAQVSAMFPEAGAADFDETMPLFPEGLPQVPGYEVTEELGRGGVGVVYRARHLRLNRPVALKMLLAGAWASRADRQRLSREAELVAELRHPNIVQVYDVGDLDGRPYFTMEFVEGGSLDRKLAGKPLPAREAASLLAVLAEAIEAAHRAGIVHRDLKPSNVLLAAGDTPKISDFGLARQLGIGPALTQSGAPLGTPSYMAPEQAQGKSRETGPAADLYALGAILYELLTGRPPFRAESSSATVQLVLSADPVPPSRLNPYVPRDLETICLKCLHKDPQRRYADAAALAADLRRFVEGRPIRARRVGAAEHAWRWCRRNPAVAGLAAAAFLAMAVGTAVSTAQAIRARRAESEMRAVLGFVEDRVFAAARPKGQDGGLGPEVTLRQALDAALPAVAEGFAAQPLIEARLRRTLGQSYLYLGEPGTAAEQFAASRALYARHRGPDDLETLRSMHSLAYSYDALDRRAEALKLREETLALQKATLGPDHPDTLRSMHSLAYSYDALDRRAEALKLREETLALQKAKLGPDHPDTLLSMHSLGSSYQLLGRHAEALKLYEETLALQKAKLGPDHPDTLRSMHSLAYSYCALGRLAEALELREETLARRKATLGPDHPDTLGAMNDLAASYGALGRWDEALAACDRAIALGTDVHDTWNHAASLWARTGDRAGYRDHCRRMLERFGPTTAPMIVERTAKACLLVPLGGPEQAAACDLADRAVARAQGHWVQPWAEATRGLAAYRREHFADAVAWADRCLARGPGNWNRELPSHLVRAMALSRLGRRDAAGAALARASDLYRTTVANPAGPAAGGDWHDGVICEVLRREAEAVFLDRDFPADPFARLLRLGRHEEWSAEWRQFIDRDAKVHDNWDGYADFCLLLGDVAEYHRACRETLTRFESSTDPHVWERTGRACLLLPETPQQMQRAAALIDRALAADKSGYAAWATPFFLFAKGLAEYRRNDLRSAIAFLEGKASRVMGPAPGIVLAMARYRSGEREAARRTLVSAVIDYDWRAASADVREIWIYHVLRREAEAMLFPNLPAFLEGTYQPADPWERLAFVGAAEFHGLTRASARLYADAFAAEPSLATDPERARRDYEAWDPPRCSRRYRAACMAASAGCGRGKDASNLDDEERARLRDQARRWLRAEVDAWGQKLDSDPDAKAMVEKALKQWRIDPDLAGLREPDFLDKLPIAESRACRELWEEIDAQIGRARRQK